jgi:hypothetical protein
VGERKIVEKEDEQIVEKTHVLFDEMGGTYRNKSQKPTLPQ